jgi:hypothetical protein
MTITDRAQMPLPAEWNNAVAHSLDYPDHILGPYQDADDDMHICCDGSGDPYEPSNCDFDTAKSG